MWNVGNVAHGAGACLGGLLGWALEAQSERAREFRRLTLVLLMLGLGLVAIFGRPYVNLTDAVAIEAVQLGYRALVAGRNQEAIRYLETAAESVHDAATWYNLGVAYERTSQLGKAKAAYERAMELDPLDEQYKEAVEGVRVRLNPPGAAAEPVKSGSSRSSTSTRLSSSP
jgi:tetratricopeptide (TPR) repeat protein